ncbi:MAG: DUF3592 domain-containing protein [Saprospiraceae bacterium]|nr:DUF3592 domain-containing protein [Saprospiraceae bacterium]
MELRDKIWLGFCGMFAFVGTMFLIIGWSHWQSTYRIVRNGVQTQGIVVENVHKPRRGLERQTTSLAPVVQFFTATGEQKLYYSQTYTTPVSHQVGEVVTIWYLPDDLNQATLNGADAWIFPVVFGIFGVAAALIGYPALLKFLFRKIFSNT